MNIESTSRCTLTKRAATVAVQKVFGPAVFCARIGAMCFVRDAERILAYGATFEQAVDRAKWLWRKV